jgi:adenylate cyclase
MMQQLEEFNAIRTISRRDTIKIGIGIHTGECMLGTIGEEDRMETTVIADTVNTASRLEGLNKRFNTSILISQKTLASLRNPGKYTITDLGFHQLRGKSDQLHIHEVICRQTGRE